MKSCVLEKIREFKSEISGKKILVALSGGSDSVCLLHGLYSLQDELCLSLCAVHVNHGIRGKEAENDEDFSKKLCDSLKIPIKIFKCDVPQYARKKGKCEEDAARELRYNFLFEGKAFFGADFIATAHNKNDQAETVLMRIFKKASSKGLSGIRPYRSDGVIRPIICCEKQDIINYINDNNLSYCEDKTNSNEKYLRNKIRRGLLPQIMETFPNCIDALFDVAKISSEEDDALTYCAKKELLGNVMYESGGIFVKKELFICPIPIILRALNLLIFEKFGEENALSATFAQRITNLMRDEKTGKKVILKNLCLTVSYNGIIISKKEGFKSFSYNLNLGEEVFINEAQMSVLATMQDTIDKNGIYIKAPAGPFSIVLRNRRNGDRFSPKGLSGTKKLKDYFIDKKVPQNLRDKIPVAVINDEIACVIGFSVSEKYAPKANTTKLIKLDIKSK